MPPTVGGKERNILQIVEHLQPHFRFTVFSPNPEVQFSDALNRIDGSTQHIVVPEFTRLSLSGIRTLARLFKEHGVDIVHSHEVRGRTHGHLAASLRSIPAIHTVHMSPLFHSDSSIKTAAYQLLDTAFNRAFSKHIIFVSNNVREEHIKRRMVHPRDAHFIPNGIDSRQIQSFGEKASATKEEIRAQLGIPPSVRLGLSVGRLHRQKGYDILLDAVALSQESFVLPDFHVIIAGDGPLRASLETQANSLGVNSIVSFAGWKSTEQIAELLVGSDFFVLPSRFECFPYALLEAAAAGLPTVTTNVGGNNEIVLDGKSGYVVEPESAEAFAKGLERLLGNPEKMAQAKQAALNHVRQFTLAEMLSKTQQVYEIALKDIS